MYRLNAVKSPCALTSKRSGDENRGKAADTTNKRSAGNVPIFTTNVVALSVAAAVDNNAHNNEYHNGDDFKQTQPVFKLLKSVSSITRQMQFVLCLPRRTRAR
jgi:hypothetical protein